MNAKSKIFSRYRIGASWVIFVALVAVVGFFLNAAPVGRDQEQIPKLVARLLPQLHLSRKPFDDALAQAALDVFLNTLDYEHCYFLASDIEEFRKQATRLDDAMRNGDVSPAFQIYDLLKMRVSNRVAFVERLLENGFQTQGGMYAWKRKDAPWPRDEEEWNELWRKKIENEYLVRVVAERVSTNPVIDRVEEEPDAKTTQENGNEAAGPKLTPEQQILKAYRQYFTVLNDNDEEWVFEQFLSAFARAYDPHTDYMSKSASEDFDIGMTLSLTGIGALLTTEDGATKVERLIPGGPAERDGRLKPGDKIIAVGQGDGEPVDVLHWPLRRTVRLIRGKKGTKVVLTVIRASDPTGATIEKIDLIRDEVRLEEQAPRSEVRTWRSASGLVHKFGIIYLPEFYSDAGTQGRLSGETRSSSKDVRRELEKLKAEKVEGIVLDLRNNGGGLLSEAVETTGLFIDSGPVVQVQSRAGLRILTDDDPVCVYDGPLVVLVNRQTASASEILTAALQDYGRAIVVGDRRTHGKGTVQSLAPIRSGRPEFGTLKVTTATFHRIDGSSTQLRGVEPDIVMPSILDALDLGEESLPYALPWSKVYPCLYRRSPERELILPELRARAQERSEKEQRYRTYLKLVESISERQKMREMPLDMDARLRMARAERDLQRELSELLAEFSEDAERKKAQDIVLFEGLQVLSDWVEFKLAAQQYIAARRELPVAE